MSSGNKWRPLGCQIEAFAGCSALLIFRYFAEPLRTLAVGRARTKAPAACRGFFVSPPFNGSPRHAPTQEKP